MGRWQQVEKLVTVFNGNGTGFLKIRVCCGCCGKFWQFDVQFIVFQGRVRCQEAMDDKRLENTGDVGEEFGIVRMVIAGP